jgi:type I restriction enzyme M protein
MTAQTHQQLASFIWSICNLLRGPYKRNEYRKVILPLTVLRRFDCILVPTKAKVLAKYEKIQEKSAKIVQSQLCEITKRDFYNISKLDFPRLLDDPNHLAKNVAGYISGFSNNVRDIMDRFAFGEQIGRMSEKNLLYEVIKAFANIDLSPERVDNHQMGYVFEELIRIGAEQSNEEAGEHFTPREVIRLMVNLLLAPEKDLAKSSIVKKIFDPACGTGGMLSVAEEYIRSLNAAAKPFLFGQDWNDEAWAICRSDMLIKGKNADNIVLGDSFEKDGFAEPEPKNKFDYMLANPPFGVEWKQQQKFIEKEAERGDQGRFGAGLPRVNDGALLFLQHMIAKMQSPQDGGSRIGIIFNGSPLFTGDAGSGESEIRKWIITNDWLEAVVALPDQLFYNTGISTYLWILTNRKEPERKGKIQLIDARHFYVKMRKSLGNKRNEIGDGTSGRPDQIGDITRIYANFRHDEKREVSIDGQVKKRSVSKIFTNDAFGFHKVSVERPLRLNFAFTEERIAKLEVEPGFQKLATSQKHKEDQRLAEIENGRERQEAIRTLLKWLKKAHGDERFIDREQFLSLLKNHERTADLRLDPAERKAILSALSERDETAEICRDSKGNAEPDAELRDTEIVPLTEEIEVYFKREVLPHVPDAWPDKSKTKIGYEIPLNRHFYVYEPPRGLEEIEEDIKSLESEILNMLKEVTA